MHEFYHALNLVPGMSYIALTKLWHRFRSWKYAFTKPSFKAYLQAGLTEDLSLKIIETRKHLDINRTYESLSSKNIHLILCDDAEFPNILKTIPWPPFGLYYKGAPLHETLNGNPKSHAIAIVGTRIPSTYGLKVAYEIAEKISVGGGFVVSGLAFGIDAAAHRAAVKNNKPTIGVLASGLNNITPNNHTQLAQNIIASGGTLVSEYATDNILYKGNFLARNRLISGLSQATIVIEAKQKSGALITIRHALEQGRDTYALVGDITRSQAQGCLNLLIEGSAQPIFSIDELINQLGFQPKQAAIQQLTQNEITVLTLIKNVAFTTEELSSDSGLEIWTLAGILTQLEVKGLIRKNGEGRWKVI